MTSKDTNVLKPPANAGVVPLSKVQPAGAGGQAHTRDLGQVVQEWLNESLASAPPPDRVHISTHLKSCIPALVAALK